MRKIYHLLMQIHLITLSTILYFCLIAPSNAACKYENSISVQDISIGTVINWTTFEEIDNAMFLIEKSVDGLTFSNIGAVKGAGNSATLKDYSFMDITPSSEQQVYYRLRQIDFSGSFHFSNILSLNKQSKNNFIVTEFSSVEATDHFEVSIDATNSSILNYSLKDWRGHVIQTNEKKLIEGNNTFSLDLTSLKEAIYKLDLKVGEEKETLTFKKIKGVSEKENMVIKQTSKNKFPNGN